MDALARRGATRGLAAARRLGILGLVVVVVPLSSMLSVLATVALCLVVWRTGPSYTEGLLFPAISELGIDMPERRVYQVGFAVTGALMALCILFFQELAAVMLLPLQNGSSVLISGLRSAPQLNGCAGVCQGTVEAGSGRMNVRLESGEVKAVRPENLAIQLQQAEGPDAELLRSLLRWGYYSAAGVALQGVFTLEHGLSLQCFIHWGGAVLFLLGAMQHAKASNDLYDAAAKRSSVLLQDGLVTMALRVRHFILDYSSACLFLVPLLMQVLPRSSGGDKEDASSSIAPSSSSSSGAAEKAGVDLSIMNAMGAMQWGIILQFALYFCTYTADLLAAARHATAKDGKES